jgi:malonyl CoA-acyl carrier protein transacylase
MDDPASRAIAIVGLSAILPDAPDVATFWSNLKDGRYSIREVPPERWDPAAYWDPDPTAPCKTYSKLGGWVTDWEWEPMKWRLPIPPKVADAMDVAHRWAIAGARAALADCGHAERPLDTERTAVVVGTAMAGDKHYLTSLPIFFPEYARALEASPSFAGLASDVREAVLLEARERLADQLPGITEDTMPGELANCMGGRIAGLFDFHGPNFACDAACASALAAIDAATDGLLEGEFDSALVAGIDRNMGPTSFVKFSKIGALSATGTRPYAEGADGFVMGEGAVFFVVKRLAAAEQAGDRIYAVLRGIGGSSDGRGKGITAPNPVGQRLAIERAWRRAGIEPGAGTLIEGHGTSTAVGDVVEFETLSSVFGERGVPARSMPLGSVKSNIGHLKGAAGAAGLLKAVLALHEKVLPPSLHCERPNTKLDFESSPLYVNTELKPWDAPASGVRSAGVSAFGFGGTNFHAVLEEHIPGRLTRRSAVSVPGTRLAGGETRIELKAPLRGAAVVGARDAADLRERLLELAEAAEHGNAPAPRAPAETDLRAPQRVAIDYGDAAELAGRCRRAAQALGADQPGAWSLLRNQGVFRGRGDPSQIAFLYTGQGSQYVNMLRELRAADPIVRETFDEADQVMDAFLERPLSDYVFAADEAGIASRTEELKRTEITQPAVLTVDVALTRLLESHGLRPAFVMGHSLGEYGALVAAGALPFADALEAVSARGREMADLQIDDPGRMAAVFAPLEQIEQLVEAVGGELVIANVNSTRQAVVGGASEAVERLIARCDAEGLQAVPLPVSHAFHTSIVAPASEPLRRTLQRLSLRAPEIPLVANVNGEFYPTGPGAESKMLDLLAAQVASPVQFVKGLRTLHDAGARVFVEVGPKRALQGFVADVFADDPDVVALFTNHPKTGEIVSFNHALCGLYAAGHGAGHVPAEAPAALPAARAAAKEESLATTPPADAQLTELGRLFAEFVERGARILGREEPSSPALTPVVSGASLGLPGRKRVFDDGNVQRILDGEQEIDLIPTRFRHAMVDKHITRLVKGGAEGPRFEAIDDSAEVIKLAARSGALDLEEQFGVDADRVRALDVATRLAMAAGIDALRDAGIPLVRHYRTTTKGTLLPERWMLPASLRDETGVIFASAFPGFDAFADELTRYFADHSRHSQLTLLRSLLSRCDDSGDAAGVLHQEIERRIHESEVEIENEPYAFDRRFLFRILPMAHAQFAEHVGARGPNTHVNAACASTTQAFALAEDWIRAGRCRRVVVIAADDVTSDHLIEWIGSGFLATGAAATDDVVEDAAVPFDRRRHGMIMGMGAAGVVIESPECARERGVRPICEVLSTVTANSAFHGTRLDVQHIGAVMEQLVAQAEQRHGLDRHEIAPALLFVSHETYTPARGGSASAEVHALREVFGASADRIVVANTKGLTGHPMGVGIEDVVAIKSLETGVVPPVPNYREPDPELGTLHLSRGGAYPIRYALRLGAGFGSQISLSLLRWSESPDGVRPAPDALGFHTRIADAARWEAWVREVSGDPEAEIEVVRHTLRIKDRGPGTAKTVVRPTPAPAEPQPVATVAEAAPTAEAPGAEADADQAIRDRVLQIVSEKTGYPADMLELDLDLEADLGIDTVKQAETFAAIREAWGIPRDEALRLRDYPTLAHAIRFVKERLPGDSAAPSTEAAPTVEAPSTKAAPTVEAPGAEADADQAIRDRVLQIVSEKTGYPADMLELDLDLEADLGIDTVKQAETFAAIREAWDIPRDEALRLRDYPTLAHAIRFVKERMPSDSASPAAAAGPEEPEREAPRLPQLATVRADDAAAARVPRRIPAAVLRPPLALCRPTSVALEAGDRVAVMPDEGGVATALLRRFEERGVIALDLGGARREEMADRVAAALAGGPLRGIYWLAALDDEGDLASLDDSTWHEAIEIRVKCLYETARRWHDEAGLGRFLIAATRLGGHHGYGPEGATAPLGGGVVGFAKAFKRERPDALVKAVDFAADADPEAVADALIDEALLDPGAVEIGHSAGRRFTVTLEEAAPEPALEASLLKPDSVVLVTGAAGSIVSAIVADLARACGGGTFHLLDLAPEPDEGDADVARFETDRDGLRRDLQSRLREKGARGTPVEIERELTRLERAHAASVALAAVRAAGGTAHYHSVDLTDADAVARVTEKVKLHGRVDLLLHAAGLERSRQLPDKEPAEFDLVFDVKCDGWFHLVRALATIPIGATVCFSSISGRLGNAGQTDYSAANDLLARCTSALRRTHPDTRGLAIDWTAWGGIGMAARGSIPEIMARAGIDMLDPAAGVAIVRQELDAGRRGEVLIAERLGLLVSEWHETGGLDPAALADTEDRPLIGEVTGMPVGRGLSARTRLDPKEQPFLRDHALDGTPLLPGVMGLEAFAELACLLEPGRAVAALEDVEFLAPFKFYRQEPRTLELEAQLVAQRDGLLARCRLIGVRDLPGREEPQQTLHFRAGVRLASGTPGAPERIDAPAPPAAAAVGASDIYRVYFHGPAFQVLESAWRDRGQVLGRAAAGLPELCAPPTATLLTSPRLLELCFQTAGIAEIADTGGMGLPQRIERVEFPGQRPARLDGCLCAVTRRADGAFDATVSDGDGAVCLRMSGYRTAALPGGLAEALLTPLREGLR